MARGGIRVKMRNNFPSVRRNMSRNMKEAFEDIVLDAARVSSDAAPHETGHLERNRKTFTWSDGRYHADIKFRAVNTRGRRPFDYARWTHDANYSLGEGSRRKSGGNSNFGSRVPVGTGYLSNTLSNNRSGYLQHLDDAYKKSLKN